jgi:hypothetical protein
MAVAPNLVAGTDANDPIKLPMAVLTADTIYTSFMMFDFCHEIKVFDPNPNKTR